MHVTHRQNNSYQYAGYMVWCSERKLNGTWVKLRGDHWGSDQQTIFRYSVYNLHKSERSPRNSTLALYIWWMLVLSLRVYTNVWMLKIVHFISTQNDYFTVNFCDIKQKIRICYSYITSIYIFWPKIPSYP